MSMLFESFPNFTEAMWNGDAPCGKGHEHVDGGHCDRWSTRYGGGESYKGRLIHANFSLNQKVTVYIVGSALWIVDIRYAGKHDVWEYSSDPEKIRSICISPAHVHSLEPEKIEKILSTDIDCLFWRMVRDRAREIYAGAGG